MNSVTIPWTPTELALLRAGGCDDSHIPTLLDSNVSQITPDMLIAATKGQPSDEFIFSGIEAKNHRTAIRLRNEAYDELTYVGLWLERMILRYAFHPATVVDALHKFQEDKVLRWVGEGSVPLRWHGLRSRNTRRMIDGELRTFNMWRGDFIFASFPNEFARGVTSLEIWKR